MEYSCAICKKNTNDSDISLLDNNFIHQECLDLLDSNETNLDEKIKRKQRQIAHINEELYRFNKFYYRIASLIIPWLSNAAREKRKEQDEAQHSLKTLSRSKEKILESRFKKLHLIYNNMTNRQPEWQNRKWIMIENKPYCDFCDKNVEVIYVLHKKVKSIDGSHNLGILEIHCEECFSEKNRKEVHEFHNTTELLRYAIENNRAVKIGYRDTYGRRSLRVIYPEMIGKINRSINICVQGFCCLRKSSRNFAIKRITEAIILDQEA